MLYLSRGHYLGPQCSKGSDQHPVDHARAAELALEHLVKLGHRVSAFIKGQEFSSDTEIRWNAIRQAASRLGLTIHAELTTQLRGDSHPDLGYPGDPETDRQAPVVYRTLQFNDISAIAPSAPCGIRTRIPEDVSVVGFDDIQSAAFQTLV